MGPNIAVLFDGESGTCNTLTVLTTDTNERHRGLAVIQELRAELEPTTDLAAVATEARAIEALGYDGAFTFEGPHDPFFPLAFAAEHTTRLEIATAVAIALPRSPMQLAHTAHDLNVLAKGRLILGLGSQVKAHIEKRYGATWTRPLARMREHVLALRAIWRCWNENAPLDFRGELYRHTLMTPFFNPGPSPFGPPRVFLGGVGAAIRRSGG